MFYFYHSVRIERGKRRHIGGNCRGEGGRHAAGTPVSFAADARMHDRDRATTRRSGVLPRTTDSPVRHGPPVPAAPIATRPATRAPARARGRQRQREETALLGWLAVTGVVLVLVAGALWVDRDRHAPVAGYGIVPQPGASAVSLAAGLEVGDVAPNFRLLAAAGEIVELAGLRGEPVVLHFTTTWCLECASQVPGLQQLADEGAQVLGIDVSESAGRVSAAADRAGATYPMLLDTDSEVAHHYGYWEYPVTVVLDAEGVIVAIHVGQVEVKEIAADLDAAGP